MDQIIADVWENVTALNGTQWSLVVAFSLAIGYVLFRFFKWHYHSRHEAQSQLIELKDQQIKYYAGVVESGPTRAERKRDNRSAVAPLNWEPFVQQAADYLDSDLRETQGQQHMNRISADLGSVTDADLFVTYVRLYEALSEEGRRDLLEEQSHWLDKRQRIAKESIQSHGGSLAPLEYNLAFIEETKNRHFALKERLASSKV